MSTLMAVELHQGAADKCLFDVSNMLPAVFDIPLLNTNPVHFNMSYWKPHLLLECSFFIAGAELGKNSQSPAYLNIY